MITAKTTVSVQSYLCQDSVVSTLFYYSAGSHQLAGTIIGTCEYTLFWYNVNFIYIN